MHGCVDITPYSARGHAGWQRCEGNPTGSSHPTSLMVVGDNHEAAAPSTYPDDRHDRRDFSMTTNDSYDHANDTHAPTNDPDERTHDFLQFSHSTQDTNTNPFGAESANDDDMYLGDLFFFFARCTYLLTNIV